MKEPTPPTRMRTSRQLNSIVGYMTGVAVACGVIMWSVFNIWLNVLAYWNRDQAAVGEQRWWVAGIVVLVTCGVPMLIGLRLLFRSLSTAKKR